MEESVARRRDHDEQYTFLTESPRYYKVLELVGEGETSKVYRCSHNNQVYAIKFVRKAKLQSSERASAMIDCELAIHRALKKNPYICKVKGCYQDKRYIYFTYDYIRGGTLAELIAALRGSRYPPVVPIPLIKMWLCQLISVLRALRLARCVHRDIKPQNIMLNLGDISVIDFSLGEILTETDPHQREEAPAITTPSSSVSKRRVLPTEQYFKDRRKQMALSERGGRHNNNHHVGTPGYWPPEISLARNMADDLSAHTTYPYAADIWAVGCVMYELMTGRLPFRFSDALFDNLACDTAMPIEAYVDEERLDWPDDVCESFGASEEWDALRDLCRHLLEPDPALRQLFIDNDPLRHKAFTSMPAYLPADLDPFALHRSIVACCARRSRLNSTLSSMELTPNVGQPFWGQLVNDCLPASKEDQQETSSMTELDRSIGHAQEVQYINGADQISRKFDTYGLRMGRPPRHVLEWRLIEADQKRSVDGLEPDGSAASPGAKSTKQTTPDTLASRNSPMSRSADNLDGAAQSVRCRSGVSGTVGDDAASSAGLADLSAQVNVSRMMNKIEGFLAIQPDKKSSTVKLWGAAEIVINMTKRRNSLETDSHQMCGYCCGHGLRQSFSLGRISKTHQPNDHESLTEKQPSAERLLGYALLCADPLELYILLEARENPKGGGGIGGGYVAENLPLGFKCENINRLWYLKVCPQGPATPMAPDRVYVHGDVVDIQLRVGNELNRQAWIKAIADP